MTQLRSWPTTWPRRAGSPTGKPCRCERTLELTSDPRVARHAAALLFDSLQLHLGFADDTLTIGAGMRPPRQWAGLRFRRLGCISASVGFTLALVLTALSSASFTVFFVLFDVAVVVMTAARIRLHKWRCPRCLRPFSVKDVWSREWPFTDKCRHCGFPVWSHLPSGTTLPSDQTEKQRL